MKDFEKLRVIMDEATPILENTLADERCNFKGGEARVKLAQTNCGYATAALQYYLRERHGIETTRLIGYPPQMPTPAPLLYADDPSKADHVVLCTEDGEFTIDPTNRQVFAYVGLTALRLNADEKLAELLEETPKIAVFPTDEAREFADTMTELALRVRSYMLPRLRYEVPPISPAPLYPYRDGWSPISNDALIDADDATLRRIFRNIWTPNYYTDRLEVERQSAGMQGDVKRILEVLDENF